MPKSSVHAITQFCQHQKTWQKISKQNKYSKTITHNNSPFCAQWLCTYMVTVWGPVEPVYGGCYGPALAVTYFKVFCRLFVIFSRRGHIDVCIYLKLRRCHIYSRAAGTSFVGP